MNRQVGSKIYVAMSGGVDSSVAAAFLKKQGHFVGGVFFKPWSPEMDKSKAPINSGYCAWQQDRQDVMRACARLGIPFKTWDFSKEYEKEVVRYMIKSYRTGITPNPDVMCNDRIKFGVFLQKAISEGADFIATGHYVRLVRKPQITDPESQTNSKKHKTQITKYKLLKGADSNKDQSYFLSELTQKDLSRTLFPVGSLKKSQVRKNSPNPSGPYL